MLFFDGFIGLALVAVWVYCVLDAITTPEEQVRNLPKLAWVLVVILLLDLGALAWLLAGRPRGRGLLDGTSEFGAAPRGGRVRAPRTTVSPDDDPEFLAQLRKRIDEQRRGGADPS